MISNPSNTTVAFLDEGASEQPLQIPAQTQAVELRSVGPDPLWGVASIQPPQATDALLLPALQPCPLAVSSNAGTQPRQRHGDRPIRASLVTRRRRRRRNGKPRKAGAAD